MDVRPARFATVWGSTTAPKCHFRVDFCIKPHGQNGFINDNYSSN
jgi:hypothetical protein